MANEAIRLIGGGNVGEREQPDEVNLREVWNALLRRKWILLFIVLLATGGMYYWSIQQTPRYTAETLIHVQNREAQVVQIAGVVEEMVADPATIESEIQLLNSREFLRNVVTELNLVADPEFNPMLRPEEPSLLSYLNPMSYVPAEWMDVIFRSSGEEPSASSGAEPLDPDALALVRTVDALKNRTEVMQAGQSYVISLKVTSEVPRKAAMLANALAEQYLVAQVAAKFEASERATEWLRQRIDELRSKVLEAEAKIVEYRSSNDIVDTQSGSPVVMQLTQLNTQLTLSQAQRAEAEAKLGQVRSILGSTGGGQAAAKVLDSPLMSALREQETELIRRISELSSEYGERHPQMVNLRSDIGSVREKMQDEVDRIVQDLQNQVAVAGAREAALQTSLNELQGRFADRELAEVELGNLTREAEANRQLFTTFLTRFNEIMEQQELQEADARVLSVADVPTKPSFPRTMLFTMIAFVGSLAAGALLVFVRERWESDYGFRSADEVHSTIGAKALALVPDLSRRETQGVPAEDYVLQRPNSAFAEAMQRIRTSLFLSENGQLPKTFLITSSVPLEGKSTVAAALARQSAWSGLKVILIDADLRRPRLHEVIGLPNQHGLSEVLTGRANPEAAIKRDEKSGLDFLSAGIGVVSPPDLFRSSTMRILLEEMSAYYDLVIIDSPPVAAVSDGFTLSGLVDKSIYVVRWAQTPRNVVIAGMRQMIEAGADIAGVVLSRVDVKKHARYSYTDSGYYQGYYRKYYVN